MHPTPTTAPAPARTRLLSSSAPDTSVPAAHAWIPFLLVVAAYAVVALQQVTLPGVYMDAVNPDYLAAGILNRRAESIGAWLLPGNYLYQRYPVLISFYHGSQQLWLGLPFFWLFGTTVTGLRLTHAMFALAILAALYAFLKRSGVRPWQAAIACAVLAIDPSFSYAFRTQSYITLAPTAWLFLSLYALSRAGEGGPRRTGWLAASGLSYGFAVVAYFIYAFFLPALLLAVRWSPAPARTTKAWIALTLSVAVGSLGYVAGYALAIRGLGGVAAAWDYFQQTQRALNAFGEQGGLVARLGHVATMGGAVFTNWFHHALIFGEMSEVPGGPLKMAVLVAAPIALWVRAERLGLRPTALRTVVALALSFVLVALVFGARLSGHHFVVLVPLSYAALALGVATLGEATDSWRSRPWAAAAPFAILVGLNVAGQVQEGLRLHELRGVALYSDAINRLASDLDANPRKPFVYFPDWGLSMPVAFLTRGRVGIDTETHFESARHRLCEGRDIAVAFITGDRAARIAQWQQSIAWDAPQVVPYAQGDGRVVFELATFRGRADGPGCPK